MRDAARVTGGGADVVAGAGFGAGGSGVKVCVAAGCDVNVIVDVAEAGDAGVNEATAVSI